MQVSQTQVHPTCARLQLQRLIDLQIFLKCLCSVHRHSSYHIRHAQSTKQLHFAMNSLRFQSRELSFNPLSSSLCCVQSMRVEWISTQRIEFPSPAVFSVHLLWREPRRESYEPEETSEAALQQLERLRPYQLIEEAAQCSSAATGSNPDCAVCATQACCTGPSTSTINAVILGYHNGFQTCSQEREGACCEQLTNLCFRFRGKREKAPPSGGTNVCLIFQRRNLC